MKRARLAEGLDVTAIGLGTAPLGGLFAPVSDEDAEATIERAWSLGVRFFDTAPLYGFGLGERRLGGFLRQQGLDSFAISTKVGRLLRSTTALRKTVITREHPPSGRNSTSATTV